MHDARTPYASGQRNLMRRGRHSLLLGIEAKLVEKVEAPAGSINVVGESAAMPCTARCRVSSNPRAGLMASRASLLSGRGTVFCRGTQAPKAGCWGPPGSIDSGLVC
jgi:hypothetical protein